MPHGGRLTARPIGFPEGASPTIRDEGGSARHGATFAPTKFNPRNLLFGYNQSNRHGSSYG
jgi:hypothetical protein